MASPSMDVDMSEVPLTTKETKRKCDDGDTGCSGQQRAVIELEFVQCLANPHYLNWLAQNRYFDDPAFCSYLAYLKYWRQPEYSCLIQYPHCLFFLDLVQSSDFRKAMASNSVAEFIHVQQYHFWQNYALNRAREAA